MVHVQYLPRRSVRESLVDVSRGLILCHCRKSKEALEKKGHPACVRPSLVSGHARRASGESKHQKMTTLLD